MIKKKRNPSDISVLAYQIVKEATEGIKEETPVKEKNPAAVALGRLGGLKGGRVRAERLSPKKRKQIAQKAAKARWAKGQGGIK
jgi:hypothetical protein